MIEKYEHWLTPIALFGGFVIDNLTLRRADLLIENLLLCAYFLFALGAILIWHRLQAREQRPVRSLELEALLFLAIQFVFGGLFSALAVFYIKSASLAASWPFLAVLIGGMIATEYLKKHFAQFLIQLSTLYLLLFTYLIIVVPLALRQIGSAVFVLSGAASLALICAYLVLVRKAVPSLMRGGNAAKATAAVIAVFLAMNAFYFLNVIPPIPLALRDSGVYKSVVRTDTGYVFAEFAHRFSWRGLRNEYATAGAPVYFFSQVYAPVRFEQNIVHEWQKKDSRGNWVRVSSVAFPIYGGSDSGYRGYSVSRQVTSGQWRVLVKTSNGQTLGGETFTVL